MKKKLKILMVLPEIFPFSKTGGLGDMGGGLARVLKESGHDIRIVTPQYLSVNERRFVIRDVIRLQNIEVPVKDGSVEINVKSAFLPNTKVQVYFIDYRPYFFRSGLYVDEETGAPYPDNASRFALFARGTLETLIKLHWQPDVIHCMGWQTGLIPLLLKEVYQGNAFFDQVVSLFTFPKLTDAETYDIDCLDDLALPESFDFKSSGLNHGGRCDFLKSGLVYSDKINALSQDYLDMIQKELDQDLKKALQQRSQPIPCIRNGVDALSWNPAEDPLIPHVFSEDILAFKAENKAAVTSEYELDAEKPLMVFISHLSPEKGASLTLDFLKKNQGAPFNWVVLGHGDSNILQQFASLEKESSGAIKVLGRYDEKAAHALLAAADFGFFPALHESSGMTLLQGLRYGVVPLASPNGVHARIVEPVDKKATSGFGLLFEPSLKKIQSVFKEAVNLYQDKEVWSSLVARCFNADFSWETVEKQYVDLYKM